MIKWVSILILFSVKTLPAQLPSTVSADPGVAPRTLSTVYSNRVSSAKTVDDLNSILREAFSTLYAVDDDAVPDLFGKATGYLHAAKPVIARSKKNAESKALFSACSLSTLAAVLQLVQARYDRDLRQLQLQRSDAHEKIRSMRERICELEKKDSDSSRNGADPKFLEMQSPQIQVNGDSRGTVISVSDILFETGSAALTPDLSASLARFAKILLTSTKSRVMIEGHTDNRGPEAFNQTLSEQRAQSVMKFLSEQGVPSDRLCAFGYGMSRPIGDNDTVDGRKRNRRVDLVVQENVGVFDDKAAGRSEKE